MLTWDNEKIPPWTPTREQMARYLAREVELARENLSRLGFPKTTSVGMLRNVTLHSIDTLEAARR